MTKRDEDWKGIGGWGKLGLLFSQNLGKVLFKASQMEGYPLGSGGTGGSDLLSHAVLPYPITVK